MLRFVDLPALLAALAAGVLLFRNYSGLKAAAPEGPDAIAAAASRRTSSDDRYGVLHGLGVLAVIDFDEVLRRVQQKGNARAQMVLLYGLALLSLTMFLVPRVEGIPGPAVFLAFAVGLAVAAAVSRAYRAWWERRRAARLTAHAWLAWLESHVFDPLMESLNASLDVIRWIEASPHPELKRFMDERYRDTDLMWQVDEESFQRRRAAIERRTAEFAQNWGYSFRSPEWQRWQGEVLRQG